MKTKHILLTIALVAFAIGFSDLQENIIFWLGRPVGAIVIIAYYIMVLLEKEYALFDEANGAKVSSSSEIRTTKTLAGSGERGSAIPARA